jgi:hypothetical protein
MVYVNHIIHILKGFYKLIGKFVKFERGPAAVTGDLFQFLPLSANLMGRPGSKDDPGARRPAF